MNFVEKPGTGIFLMKENAKLYKAQKERKSFTLSKRLADDDHQSRQEESKGGETNKRMKGNDGKMISIGASSNQNQIQTSHK
jgi:hypothetical protein